MVHLDFWAKSFQAEEAARAKVLRWVHAWSVEGWRQEVRREMIVCACVPVCAHACTCVRVCACVLGVGGWGTRSLRTLWPL